MERTIQVGKLNYRNKVVKWEGNQVLCDICKGRLRKYDTYIDGRINNTSHWALMCKDCWRQCGAGLGTGYGQEYDSVTNEKIRG